MSADVSGPKKRKQEEYVVIAAPAHDYTQGRIRDLESRLKAHNYLQDKLYEKSHTVCLLVDRVNLLEDGLRIAEKKCKDAMRNYEEVVTRRDATRSTVPPVDAGMDQDDDHDSLIPIISQGVSKDLFDRLASENRKLRAQVLEQRNTKTSNELKLEAHLIELRNEMDHMLHINNQLESLLKDKEPTGAEQIVELTRQLAETNMQLSKKDDDFQVISAAMQQKARKNMHVFAEKCKELQDTLSREKNSKKEVEFQNKQLQRQVDTLLQQMSAFTSPRQSQTAQMPVMRSGRVPSPPRSLHETTKRLMHNDIQHDGPSSLEEEAERTASPEQDLQQSMQAISLDSKRDLPASAAKREVADGALDLRTANKEDSQGCTPSSDSHTCDTCLQEFRSLEKWKDHTMKCLPS